jgi:hypothetical protein
MAKSTLLPPSGPVYVTSKKAGLRLVTTADHPEGIAAGSRSGFAPVTVALIREAAPAAVIGEGDATCGVATGLGLGVAGVAVDWLEQAPARPKTKAAASATGDATLTWSLTEIPDLRYEAGLVTPGSRAALLSTYSRARMAYPLPAFVSRTLADQSSPPRQVPILAVIRAVVGGMDCAIYVWGALAFIAFALTVMAHLFPSVSRSSDVWGGLTLVALGAFCSLLPIFRIRQVTRALRSGDAELAEIVQAEVGRARIYGTPWGDPMFGASMQPIAAKGTYRLLRTGETGGYYMQQWWATTLRPEARIWVLRRNGRDILYAPV